MVRWIALVAWGLVACTEVACTEAPTEAPAASARAASVEDAPAPSSSAALVERGGRWTVGVFSGSVVRVEGASVEADAGSLARVGVADARVGEPLLGHVDPDGEVGPDGRRWEPCRVRRLADGAAWVEDRWGNLHRLPPEDLARPLDPTAVGRALAAAAARRGFDERVAERRPAPPPGWTPARDEAVVVRLDTAYLGATVRAVDAAAALVRVRFDDGARRDRDLPQEDVVPAAPAPVEEGELALLRPSDPTTPWAVVRVRRAGPDPEVEDRAGERRRPGTGRLRGFRPVAPAPAAQ